MAKTAKTLASKPQHLPQYVGPAEVCAALGISRSTLDRMRREGGFPVAEKLSPNRVGWRVDVIEEHRSRTGRALVSHARADPAELSPAQLEDAALDAAAQHLSASLGRDVGRDDVVLGVAGSTEGRERISEVLAAAASVEAVLDGLSDAEVLALLKDRAALRMRAFKVLAGEG